MRLELFAFAEYAANTQDNNKLVLAGLFNTLTISRAPEPAAGQVVILPMPQVYLVAVVTASISEGLSHRAELRVRNADEHPVIEPVDLGVWNFVVNPHGRPMRFQGVIAVRGLPLPGAGEYSFELSVDGTPVGQAALYVDETGVA